MRRELKGYFCVGTYSQPIRFGTGQWFRGKGEGLYLCGLEGEKIRILEKLALCNPSYLAIAQGKGRIYAVNETKAFQGQPGGGISEIAYDGRGRLTLVRQLPTGGGDPCHVSLAPDGSALAVSNYAGGSVAVWPLDRKGGIAGPRQLFQHRGGSIHPRQQAPHAHCAIFLSSQALVAADLGKDALVWYGLAGGRAVPQPAKDCPCAAGSGPRTGVLSQDGQNLYILNELSASITRFRVEEGGLTRGESLPILPEGMEAGAGSDGGGDLQMAPDGRHIYASHRGAHSISGFRIGAGGALERVSWTPCGGATPRNFAIDPHGETLLCGNQDSDTISIFNLTGGGGLEPIAQQPFPTPVCIRFFQDGLTGAE